METKEILKKLKSFANCNQKDLEGIALSNIEWPKAPEVITGIFIMNKRGEIALFNGVRWHDIWTLPGGHVEVDETVQESLSRELMHEVGVEVSEFQFIRYCDLIELPEFHRKAHFVALHFLCRFDGEFDLDKTELTGYQWFSISEILELDEVNDSMKETVRQIQKMQDKIFQY